MATTITPFQVNIDPSTLNDFKQRLQHARWSDPISLPEAPNNDWSYGTSHQYLQRVQQYVASPSFDFLSVQSRLNSIPQFTARVPNTQGAIHHDKTLHYLHQPATDGSPGIPLLLLHGWPSTPFNFIDIIPLLAQQGFDVVAPTIPGYGFSSAPTEPGFGAFQCAHVFQSLMVDVLGYEDGYVVQGGDWGSIIGRCLANQYPTHVLAYHTNMPLPLPPTPASSAMGDGPRFVYTLAMMAWNTLLPTLSLSKAEQQGLEQNLKYGTYELGYLQLQATKPDSLGYGLNDSPLGLLSWISEKHHGWSDHGEGVEEVGSDLPISMDHLLTTALIYWSTGSITSSMRFYYETLQMTPFAKNNGTTTGTTRTASTGGDIRNGITNQFVAVPTGILVAKDLIQAPRAWVEQAHNVVQYTDLRGKDVGGHFLKLENPKAVVKDLEKFVFETLGATKDGHGIEVLKERRRMALMKEKVGACCLPGASLKICVCCSCCNCWWYVNLTNVFCRFDNLISLFIVHFTSLLRAPQQDRSNRMSKVMEMVLFGTVGLLVNSRL